MNESSEVLVVLVTCPPDKAAAIADALVDGRHAACVNILPAVTSVFRWKGKVEHDGEALLVIKSSRARYAALQQAVLEHHPYELPEVIAVPVERGHARYLDWVMESVK